jgi:hypothetical protein
LPTNQCPLLIHASLCLFISFSIYMHELSYSLDLTSLVLALFKSHLIFFCRAKIWLEAIN